jgi:hypothetical protein
VLVTQESSINDVWGSSQWKGGQRKGRSFGYKNRHLTNSRAAAQQWQPDPSSKEARGSEVHEKTSLYHRKAWGCLLQPRDLTCGPGDSFVQKPGDL